MILAPKVGTFGELAVPYSEMRNDSEAAMNTGCHKMLVLATCTRRTISQ